MSDDPLFRIARLLSDGRPIDWDREADDRPDLRSRLARMRWLETKFRDTGPLRSSSEDMSSLTTEEIPGRSPDPAARGAATALGTWGPLVLLDPIGAGGYGEVFRAYDPALQTEVALKIWFPSWSTPTSGEDLLREARVLARIRHPNVLSVLGAASHEGRFGMWSELVRGETLEDCLARQGPFGATEAALIGAELCRALAAVHAAGLVHRDVKTANVMRAEGGRIVLMDFGIVATVTPGAGPPEMAGTPLTAAPEQLDGTAVGHPADLYGLGVMLYRLVSGRYPIEARNLEELRTRHDRGDHTPLRDRRPDLPTGFVHVVERSLSRRPADRHPSAGALERELLGFLASDSAQGGPRSGRRPRAGKRASARARPGHNLPTPLTSFVGRERVVDECLALMHAHRLVTLVGPGGCGKTRLSLRAAERWLAESDDGVCFVDLSALTDGHDVARELARVLGLREGRRPIMETVVQYLGGRSTLILIDNCEQVIQACATVARDLLEQVGTLRILATSREALKIPGEQCFTVPPLSVPAPEAGANASSVEDYESAQLFLARARLVDPTFRIDAERASAVAEICWRLDGIPLAIEIAAGKLRALEVRDLQSMLDRHLGTLGDTGRSFVARHRTLEAVFLWSYDLLDQRERAMLRALTVFVGPWSLEAAVAVCGADDRDGVLRVLEQLVGKSLVSVEPRGESRLTYRLLETVRQLASQRRDGEESAGEPNAEELRRLHAGHYLAQAPSLEEGLAGPDQSAWLGVVEAEHENFVAAIRWLVGRPNDAHRGLALAAALWRYWFVRGLFSLGREILGQAMEASEVHADPVRARALCAAAFLASFPGDIEVATPMFESSLKLFSDLGDPVGQARALSGLGSVATHVGDYATARNHYELSLAIQRKSGSDALIAIALNNLGAVTWRLGDDAAAEVLHREGLEVASRSGYREGALLNLINLSWIALKRNRTDDARTWLLESFRRILDLRARHRAAEALDLAADALSRRGMWVEACRLSGASESLRDAIGVPPEDVWRRARDAFRSGARQTLGETACDRELESGRLLAYERAIALAADWVEGIGAGHEA